MGTFERVGLFVAVHGAPDVLENETLRSVIDGISHVQYIHQRNFCASPFAGEGGDRQDD